MASCEDRLAEQMWRVQEQEGGRQKGMGGGSELTVLLSILDNPATRLNLEM